MISRTSIRSVQCPKCGARPRQHCWGSKAGTRQSNHLERVKHYEKLTGLKTGYADGPRQVKKVTPETLEQRQDVRSHVACQECGAKVGEHCKTRRGERQRNHQERVWAWRRAGAPKTMTTAAEMASVPDVTEAEIEAARTPAGGFTKATLAQWGVPWPPPKGWKAQLLAESNERG